jgi:hypothetical protein
VLDNGSTDGTWDKLQTVASRHDRITIVGQDPRPFREEIRGDVFGQCGAPAGAGDWWCRLDADEHYIDDPREFLGRVPRRFGFVESATFNYYFTDRDLAEYTRDPAGWLARPVHERLCYYQNNWGEGRFVRHRSDLRWVGHIWPPDRGRICRARIRLKHFQYRSPEQIARRIAIRQAEPGGSFGHELSTALAVPGPAGGHDWVKQWLRQAPTGKATWRDRVRDAAQCDYDRGDGRFVVREDLMPRLPNVALDVVRVALRSNRLGEWMLQPYLTWRSRKR